jgi:hypothetical protein
VQCRSLAAWMYSRPVFVSLHRVHRAAVMVLSAQETLVVVSVRPEANTKTSRKGWCYQFYFEGSLKENLVLRIRHWQEVDNKESHKMFAD